MTPRELASYFRDQVRDDVAPYLWSDSEVFVYMDMAQKMFVRLTGGIFDVTSEACSVDVRNGEKYSDLHPSILHIRRAVMDEREIRIVNMSDADRLTSSDYGVVRSLSLGSTPGRVDYMVIGEQRDLARWVMVPDTDATVSLAITRLPFEDITRDSTEFEIASMHHPHLVEWMRSQAYSKPDSDTFDLKAAVMAEKTFRSYCDQVWKEWERYRHKPRTVAYGGI